MKPTKADLAALAQAERDGRVASSVTVNHAALAGDRSPFPDIAGESEREFQKRLIAFARSRGWSMIAHFRPARVTRRGKETYETPIAEDGKGFVDLILLRERMVTIEAKVRKNKRSPDQLKWAAALQRAGVEYYCWFPRDFKDIERVLS